MKAPTLVGRTIGGYAITERIGRGGMATVYRARDPQGREVALKALCAEATPGGAEAAERFAREAVWLSNCADPHIVAVFGAGVDAGVHYIAMELLPATLQRHADRPATLAELVEIGAGVLMGLAAAHRVGVIHGDLKPANVGVDRNGVIKLLDFGAANPLPWSASCADAPTRPMHLDCIGTLRYLPPEHLRGDPVDERADVYGAGAVLYEVATGWPPFPDIRPACLIDAILNIEPPPPSHLNRDLPDAFDRIVLRALAKRAEARFASVHHMLDALLAIDSGAGRETLSEPPRLRVSSDAVGRVSHGPCRQDRTARYRIDPLAAGARTLG